MSLATPGNNSTPVHELHPERWIERHGDTLFRYALARVRSQSVAEDLVQETLLGAWRARASFVGQSSEQTWLIAILKRKVIDWLRQQTRERITPIITAGTDDFTDALFNNRGHWKFPLAPWQRTCPSHHVETQEFWLVLQHCLAKLPPRLHDVFILRYLEEAESSVACAELGLTPANFWMMLHRARLRLWSCLSENWFGNVPPEQRVSR